MENKCVFITGSSRGLGKCLASEFLNAGYRTISHNRKIADLSQEEDLEKLKKYIGIVKPRIFINNAGLYNEKDVLKEIKVNLIAPIVLIDFVGEIMSKNGGGIIININSTAGKVPNYKEALYCASKFGLRGFSESVKYELLKDNVRIIDLYPGAINTGMSAHRKDRNKLIDLKEFSRFVRLITETKSFVANDINFIRTNY